MSGRNPYTYDEFPFGPDLPLYELFDASNECPHGNLPFDDNLDCRCWKIRRNDKPAPVPVVEPPKPRGHPVHVRRRAVRLYSEGYGSKDVGARLGVSNCTVLKWVRAAGVPVRKQGARRAA